MADRRPPACGICNRRSDGPFISLSANVNYARDEFLVCNNCFYLLPEDLQKIVMDISISKNIPLATSLVNAMWDFQKPMPGSSRYDILNTTWCVFSQNKIAYFRSKPKCLQYIMLKQRENVPIHYTFFMGKIVDHVKMSRHMRRFLGKDCII